MYFLYVIFLYIRVTNVCAWKNGIKQYQKEYKDATMYTNDFWSELLFFSFF